MSEILSALSIAFAPVSLLMLVLGCLFGTVIGAIPGMGTMVAISICIPFTLDMGSGPAIALLLGVYATSIYGGSISAVLINTPGTPQSACTGLDGYALALKGKADLALGWCTAASVFGGLFSCLVLVCAAPMLAKVSIYCGPLEICGFIALGLACVSSVSEGEQLKGLFMAFAGMFTALVGLDEVSGILRFTFDISAMEGGIDIMAVVVGMYPFAELFYRIFEERSEMAPAPIVCTTIRFPGLRELWKKKWTLLRSSCLGTCLGILPGTGATAATFVSYTTAKSFSKVAHNYGKGEVEGLAAAESSNNAVSGGAMVPTLALGIPGEATMALMLATFMLHGITPGVRLMADNPDVVYASFLSLICANIILIPCAIFVVRIFGRLIRIPSPLLLGVIAICSLVGSYLPRGSMTDVYIALTIGIITFALRFFHFPVAPFLIGFVLSQEFEYRLSQAVMYQADMPLLEYLMTAPAAVIIYLLAIGILIWPMIQRIRGKGHDIYECK